MNDEKLLYCSFCGKTQHQVRKLIAGPWVYICDGCVDDIHKLQTGNGSGDSIDIRITEKDEEQNCNFCGKQTREVTFLYQHDEVHVCNECIILCDDIIREEIADTKQKKDGASLVPTLVSRTIGNAIMDDAEILSILLEPGADYIEVCHVKGNEYKVVSQPPAALFYEIMFNIMSMRLPGFEENAGEISFNCLDKTFDIDVKISTERDGTRISLILQSGSSHSEGT